MIKHISIFVLSAMAIITEGAVVHPFAPICALSGWWDSDSKLTMFINEDVAQGFSQHFDGIFFKVNEQKVSGTIIGSRAKSFPNRQDAIFGIVVSFPAGSTAVWSGQCYRTPVGEILETLMLHRSPVDWRDYWLSTKVASQTWVRRRAPPSWYSASSS